MDANWMPISGTSGYVTPGDHPGSTSRAVRIQTLADGSKNACILTLPVAFRGTRGAASGCMASPQAPVLALGITLGLGVPFLLYQAHELGKDPDYERPTRVEAAGCVGGECGAVGSPQATTVTVPLLTERAVDPVAPATTVAPPVTQPDQTATQVSTESVAPAPTTPPIATPVATPSVSATVSATATATTATTATTAAPTPQAAPVACGAVMCAADQVCCNPFCGICTAPGERCSQVRCGEPTLPSSALCGQNTCNVGQVCCNPSCGICTLPGESCSSQVCQGPVVPGVVPCGMNTCNTGQVCCNPSCGICTAPGESCSPEPCG